MENFDKKTLAFLKAAEEKPEMESYRKGFDDGLERAIYELECLSCPPRVVKELKEAIYHCEYGHGYKTVDEVLKKKYEG